MSDTSNAVNAVNNSCESLVSAAYSKLFRDGEVLCNDETDKALLLASEQIVHLTDGWKYLSASLNALLNNSENNAIHLAYYAQLRGALSLFSGKGIRMKFRENFYLDSSNSETTFKAGSTHVFVWKIWQQWIQSAHAENIIKSIKLQSGLSLREIKETLTFVNPDLGLKNLGYDFFHLGKDHDERNRRSYQADQAVKELKVIDLTYVKFVKTINHLLLPLSSSISFDVNFISYLFECAVDEADESQEQNGNLKTKGDISDGFIQALSDDTGVGVEVLKGYLNFDVFDVFQSASEGQTELKNIISRSLFMLRLAMLSVQENINSFGNEGVKDWFSKWHESVGNIKPGEEILPEDLSADIEEALQGLEVNQNDLLPNTLWNQDNISHSYRLTRPDLALAWGL